MIAAGEKDIKEGNIYSQSKVQNIIEHGTNLQAH